MNDLRHPARASLVLAITTIAALGAGCGDDTGGADGAGGATSTTNATTTGATSASGSSTSSGDGGSAASTGGGDAASSTSSGACEPDCEGRVCGDDGCGATCGACDGEQSCSPAGQCVDVDPGSMSFFVTSEGNLSGDFDGLDGADAFCQALADAAGAGARTWRAYLSTSSVDARDRIGAGPWYDATGALIADDVDDLHASGVLLDNALDENGAAVPNGVSHPGFNEHDILTGSQQDGTFHDDWGSCADWTSASPDDRASTGHTDASRDGASPVDAGNNWNAAHQTQGCDQTSLNNTGSTARIYCFAE